MKRNKALFLGAKFIVSAALLSLIASKAGINRIASTLSGIDPSSMLFASLCYIVSIYFSSLRLRYLLPQGYRVGKLFSLCLIGSFFNTVLPGIVGGDAVKAYYLSKETGASSTAVASVFMDRYIGFAALILLGILAYPLGFRYFGSSRIEWILPMIALSFIAGSLVVFGLRIGSRFRFLAGIHAYLQQYRNRRDVLTRTLLLSLLVQILNFSAVYVISLGLKLEVPLLSIFLFIPIITTLATLPISLSGLGVREVSFVLLFGLLGVSPVQATALSFAWYLSIVGGSLPGLVEYLRNRKRYVMPAETP